MFAEAKEGLIKYDKIAKRVLLPILAIVVFLTAPLYQNISNKYIDNSLKNAVVTYAILRGINAGVSMVQKSSVSVGVGIEGNIAIGEVFDPLNDAVERFSDLITISIWALGSEKALYEVSKTTGFIAVVVLLSAFLLFYDSFVLKRLLTVLIIVRLFIPFSAVASNYFDKEIFTPKIEKSLKALSFSKKISASKSGSITESYREFKEKMNFYIQNATNILNELVNYSLVYFGKYFLDLIVLPLFLVYVVKEGILIRKL